MHRHHAGAAAAVTRAALGLQELYRSEASEVTHSLRNPGAHMLRDTVTLQSPKAQAARRLPH
jgi:hypothetical protein